MSYFSNPSLDIKMSETRFNALRKVLKWLSGSDDRAADMLNRINERVRTDGKFFHIPFYADETVKFAYLFASLSEAFVETIDSVKEDVQTQVNAISDIQISLETIALAMREETEIIADSRMRSFRTLKREEKAYIKRYIRNGCGGNLVAFGEQAYEEDELLPEITDEYLKSVADYLTVPFEDVKKNYQEMLACYSLVTATGYPDIGRGDKKLSEEERKEKFEKLCEVIPKYSIDFDGFQYGHELAKKLNCTETLFKRAMQHCKER